MAIRAMEWRFRTAVCVVPRRNFSVNLRGGEGVILSTYSKLGGSGRDEIWEQLAAVNLFVLVPTMAWAIPLVYSSGSRGQHVRR